MKPIRAPVASSIPVYVPAIVAVAVASAAVADLLTFHSQVPPKAYMHTHFSTVRIRNDVSSIQ